MLKWKWVLDFNAFKRNRRQLDYIKYKYKLKVKYKLGYVEEQLAVAVSVHSDKNGSFMVDFHQTFMK